MQYIFENYKFDASQQVLFQDDQIIALKSNEAKLLNLFLSRPNEILSKEVILNEVWGTRVVSEQVVFQNISHLRAIFSNAAIKTFPKKGYQWQLAIQPELAKTTPQAQIFTPAYRLGALLILSTIVLAWLFLPIAEPVPKITTNKNQSRIILIPFEYRADERINSTAPALNSTIANTKNKAHFSIELATKPITAQLFFNGPQQMRQQLITDASDLVLSGYIIPQQDGVLLRYQLQGAQRAWTGYLFATTEEFLAQQLYSQMTRLLSSQYFSLQSDSLLTAELQLLHNQYPADHQILLRLIEGHIAQKNYDVAMALTNSLIKQSDAKQNTAYLGFGYMLKGKINHLRRNLAEAKPWYHKANQILASRNLLLIQSSVAKNQGWLGYFNRDYQQVKTALYQAASLAKLAGEPLAEIESYTLLSILSNKLGQEKEKYHYLYKAKSLLQTYNLHQAHFAVIYYHFALFAKSQQQANNYFNKILNLPYLPSNQWIIEDTQKHLVQYYISRQAWSQALALFPDQHASTFNDNQIATIYYAMGDITKARTKAEQAFNQARVHYQHFAALDAALLLYRISLKTKDASEAREYQTYINDNANQVWLENNQAILKQLSHLSNT